jgi:hypothetical protein
MHCVNFISSVDVLFSEVAEDSSLSPYELARLERIKANKKMWQDLMKDIVSFFIIIVLNMI